MAHPFAVAAAAVPPLLVFVVTTAARLVSRSRERARRAARVAALGEPLAAQAREALVPETRATFVGRLAATSPRLVTFHPDGTSLLEQPNVYALSPRPAGTADVAIDLEGGGRAILEGEVQVLVGTTESEHDATLAHAAELAAEVDFGETRSAKKQGQLRMVGPGDAVVFRGVASPAPDDDASYRERGRVLRVVADASPDPGVPRAVLLAATTEAASRHAAPAATRRLFALVLAAAAVGAFGSLLLSRSTSGLEFSTAIEAPVVAASAAPACRGVVLDALARNDPDAAGIPCDSAATRGTLRFTEGMFLEASRELVAARAADPSLVPTLAEAESHLFAHDFEHAAEVVRAMSASFYQGPETAEKRYIDCIGAVLDARAKARVDAGPGPLVKDGWMQTSFRKICGTRPFAKMARELDAEGRFFGGDDWKEYQGHEYFEVGSWDPVAKPATAAIAARARLAARPVALEKGLLDRLVLAPSPGSKYKSPHEYGRLDLFFHREADTYARMSGFAADVTLFHAFAGLPERNARYWPILDRVAQQLETKKPFHVVETTFDWEKKIVEEEETFLSYVMSIGAAAAHASGEVTRRERYRALGEVYSAHLLGNLVAATKAEGGDLDLDVGDAGWPERRALLDAAASGEAEKVVSVLVAQRATGRDVFARILPRLRDRTALQTWYAKGFPAPCVTCGASAFHGHAVERRDVGRAIGGSDAAKEVARLGPVVVRFTDALTDPEIAFELDELETFFAERR